MACYVIGIGGTGAKCVEALIHLCAAGLMPDIRNANGEVIGIEDLYLAFVDSDGSNGNLERARITLTQYIACKENKLGAIDLFKTPILVAKDGVKSVDTWSPFDENETTHPTLGTFFDYDSLIASPVEEQKRTAQLLDVLYSHAEKTTTLERGFRGHPSIGAAILSSTLKFSGSEPWETFKNRIRQDVAGAGANIILVGSIFGGTGAAGLPTIARLISNEFNLPNIQNSRLGGVLVLPYFNFDPPKEEGLRADSENFLLSTQAALKYYHQQANAGRKMGLDIFDSVYTLGESQLSPVGVSSLGSTTQRNEPHIIELYAALSCLDFFNRARNNDDYNMVARQHESEIGWTDLPYSNKELLKTRMGQLTRYCFAYLSSYYPALDQLKKRQAYRAPWFVNLFERKKVSVDEQKTALDGMRDYCKSFLLWLAHVNSSSKNVTVNIVNHGAFTETKLDDENKPELQIKTSMTLTEFDNLILPETKKSLDGLDRVWESMSFTSVPDTRAEGVGRFFHALYRQCAM
jgi:hypothetical protein